MYGVLKLFAGEGLADHYSDNNSVTIIKKEPGNSLLKKTLHYVVWASGA